jgi:hypothetical protein
MFVSDRHSHCAWEQLAAIHASQAVFSTAPASVRLSIAKTPASATSHAGGVSDSVPESMAESNGAPALLSRLAPEPSPPPSSLVT